MLPFFVPQFLNAAEVSSVLLLLSSSSWYPCPLQESKFPTKSCTKVNISHLASKLDVFGMHTFNVAVTKDLPSNSKKMRHCLHYDVFPERNTTIPPNATKLVYLTSADEGLPVRLSGQTVFPRANLTVLRLLRGHWYLGQTHSSMALAIHTVCTALQPTVAKHHALHFKFL